MKPYRRVVITNVHSKSVVQSDEQMQTYEFSTLPGYEHTLVWVNPTTPDYARSKASIATRTQLFPDPAAQVSTL
jgi:hypothetical protein